MRGRPRLDLDRQDILILHAGVLRVKRRVGGLKTIAQVAAPGLAHTV